MREVGEASCYHNHEEFQCLSCLKIKQRILEQVASCPALLKEHQPPRPSRPRV